LRNHKILTGEQPDKDEMSRIAVCFALPDITEDEQVETGMAGNICVDTRNGHEDSPGKYPYWKEYFTHHAEEADKKVGIHSIDSFNILVVSLENRERPRQEMVRKLIDPLAA
jgi:hypothetical protein